MKYTAVNLDEESVAKLVAMNNVPVGWERKTHHCTLHLGERRKSDPVEGKVVEMTADAVATNGRVLAVRVSGVKSDNRTPHVTLAVNPLHGGKPVESNLLTNWMEIQPVTLKGKVAVNG